MRAGGVAALTGALLLIGALGGVLSASAATASTVPITIEFDNMMPGESRTGSDPVRIPAESVVSSATWLQRDGDAAWTAELCDAVGTCVDIDEAVDRVLPAGDYKLAVSITMAADSAQGSTAAASGVIGLVQRPTALPLTEDADGALALTGSSMPWALALTGALVLGAGCILIIVARRRRREDREEVGA